MPTFRNVPEDWGRLDFRLLQNGACHKYWRLSLLDEDTLWLELDVFRCPDCGGRRKVQRFCTGPG